MKRAIWIVALLLCAAAYVFLQTAPSTPKLATLMPGGAMLYLEAPDFGRLLRDWNGSQIKADWLRSGNFAAFSRTNLFAKLHDVYTEYGAAAGFLPDLPHLIEVAGSDSALALYDIHDVQFLYISRISQADLLKSQLWSARTKFQQRRAGGADFYLRTDAASKRTVAFAFVKDHLFLATRDDLVAQALELLAGGSNPSVASERWYRDTTAAATEPNPSELRLVMNLESIAKSVYFRSYWIQRNASEVRQYAAGLADIGRAADGNVVENRIFLRAGDGEATPQDIAPLLALVPPEAGVYKIQPVHDPAEAASLVAAKLIGHPTQRPRDWREAPDAAPEDQRTGSEADLETRIDEQPLPEDSGRGDSVEAIRAMLAKTGVASVLLLESSASASGTFIDRPSAIVLSGSQDWDPIAVRSALAAAAGKLWTTSQMGAGWTTSNIAGFSIERLDGLGNLMFVNRGKLLFVSNDPQLLAAAASRVGSPSTNTPLTYAAGFRHTRERANFERLATALDFGAGGNPGAPAFFSGNIASLSRVLSSIAEVQITGQERGSVTSEKIVYQLGR
jgi:hypothetical protein